MQGGSFQKLNHEYVSESKLFGNMDQETLRDSEITIQVARTTQVRKTKDDIKNRRTILSEHDARHIFQNKPPQGARDRSRADKLASLYGVSVKTIRDVWIGRTWYRSTCHLDPSKPVNLHRLQRKPGRPLGAKDSKPRVVQPTRRACPPSPPLTELQAVIATSCHTSAATFDICCQASTPLADWLDGDSWSISASWDDPFHNDWPFWAPDDTASDSLPSAAGASSSGGDSRP